MPGQPRLLWTMHTDAGSHADGGAWVTCEAVPAAVRVCGHAHARAPVRGAAASAFRQGLSTADANELEPR